MERRASILNCPSANEDIDLVEVLHEIVNSEVYRPGYESTTMRLLNQGEDVSYDVAIKATKTIAEFLESNERASWTL